AALSSYENRTITTGVMLLGTTDDPCRLHPELQGRAPSYTESLTSIKSFYRLAHGWRTAFFRKPDRPLHAILYVAYWSREACFHEQPDVSGPKAYEAHARATDRHGHVCAVLSPSREIKIFADGAQVFAFRGGSWHLLDLKAKYNVWSAAVGDEPLAMRLFQTALDLADAREGALFVVVRDPAEAVPQLLAPAHRLR